MAPLILIGDAASKHMHFVSLYGSGPDGCVCFANSLRALNSGPQDQPQDVTIEKCISACYKESFTWTGVGADACRMCFLCLLNEHSFLC